MKKHLLILILALPIFIGQGVSGQGYVPLVDTNKVRSNLSYFWGTPTSYMKIGGDTIIESTLYKKMYFSFDSLQITWHLTSFGIREEDKRIFIKMSGDHERILYDFNIEVGDTFLTNIDYHYCQMVVAVIDSVELENNEIRRRIVFSFESNTPNVPCELSNNIEDEEWIEGVGSKRGLMPVLLLYESVPADLHELLLCFHENDTLKYINSYIPVCYLAVNTQEYDKSQNIKVYPNPCSGQLHLSFQNGNNEELSLELISHLGKVVYSDKISNIDSYSIKTSNLANGLYLLRLSGKQQTQTIKIIVAH